MNISTFLSKYKKYILCSIVGALCIYGVHNIVVSQRPAARVSMSTVLQKTKEIDKLYTGVYIIPAVDKKYGMLKRDIATSLAKNIFNPLTMLDTAKSMMGEENATIQNDTKKVVKGYCKKRYEVSVGYANISALLSDKEIINNACHGNVDKLPNPEILAVNCRNTETRGEYSGKDMCFKWDNDENMRKALLTAQMKNNNILDKVNRRGRESLKTIATIFCE